MIAQGLLSRLRPRRIRLPQAIRRQVQIISQLASRTPLSRFPNHQTIAYRRIRIKKVNGSKRHSNHESEILGNSRYNRARRSRAQSGPRQHPGFRSVPHAASTVHHIRPMPHIPPRSHPDRVHQQPSPVPLAVSRTPSSTLARALPLAADPGQIGSGTVKTAITRLPSSSSSLFSMPRPLCRLSLLHIFL